MNATTLSAAPAATRSPAVTGIAWGFILFAALSVTLAGLSLMPGEPLAATLAVEAGSGGLTGGAAWLLERSAGLAVLLTLGALLTLALAIALLQRRPWARLAFVVLLAAGFVGVIGATALTPLTFSLLPEASTAGAVNVDSPSAGLTGTLGLLIVAATLLAALFAWAGWKLTTPAVCAEFQRRAEG